MKNSEKLRIIITMIIVLILICVNLIIIIEKMDIKDRYSNKYQEEKINTNNSINNNTASQESEEEKELNKLKSMNERGRMEYYFSKFISYIKEENYSKAYDLLYPEFRENYFKTLEDFTKYVKKLYPKSVAFSYNDIERQGYIYVLVIEVIDPTKKVGEGKSQRIVIQENDFNDFVLSFQVI